MNNHIARILILLLMAILPCCAWGQQAVPPSLCPVIEVTCPEDVDQRSMMECSVDVSGLAERSSLSFTWIVSKGLIKKGAKKASVVIDPKGMFPGSIVATVKVGGLRPSWCPNSASGETLLRISDLGPSKLSEYGDISFEKEREYLDVLAEKLREQPGSIPYIIAYAGRQAYVDEAKERAERARAYLVDRQGIEFERVVVLDGGYCEERFVELWIDPVGSVGSPVPHPTIRPEDVQLLKGKRPGSKHFSRMKRRA